MSEKITLPEKLNDGTYEYVMVRPEGPVGPDGRFEIALYERVPKDEKFQFTPDLAFCQGMRRTPTMNPVQR